MGKRIKKLKKIRIHREGTDAEFCEQRRRHNDRSRQQNRDVWGEIMTIEVLVCRADGTQTVEQREVPVEYLRKMEQENA